MFSFSLAPVLSLFPTPLILLPNLLFISRLSSLYSPLSLSLLIWMGKVLQKVV